MRAFWLGRDLLLTGLRRHHDRKRVIAAVGHPLRSSQPIHHHSLTQIVVCESLEYHMLLHRRERVLRAGGNPNLDDICQWCSNPRLKADFKLTMCGYCYIAQTLEYAIWNANVRIYGTGLGWEGHYPEATWGGRTASQLGETTLFERDRIAMKAISGRIW